MTNDDEKQPAAPDWRTEMQKAIDQLPELVAIPPELTPEGKRLADFRRVCPVEFQQKIDRTKLANPAAFDRVANWNGRYPGPCLSGGTGSAKTRAAWSALGRLYVIEARTFNWFPSRRLTTELARYEDINAAEEFFRNQRHYRTVLIDDVDKINWMYDSQKEQLFAFYDWVYRERQPCITTTNQNREWWAERMGDAFVRRLFDEAHFEVKF